MKKSLLLLALCFVFMIQNATAVPAYPYPVEITQPDGTKLTIQRFGDPFFNYTLSMDGYHIVEHADGFYYYYTPTYLAAASATDAGTMRVSNPLDRTVEEDNFVRTLNRGVDYGVYEAGIATSTAKRAYRDSQPAGVQTASRVNPFEQLLPPNALVIVAEFADKKLSSGRTIEEFQNLVSQEGYSINGSIGSARDYFVENSRGMYDPNFVVCPVVAQLPENMSYYGGNIDGSDALPAQMVYDACEAVDAYVNFADYDSNNDGVIDNVFVFYAGYNEAEGASSSTIWPHRWWVVGGYNVDVASPKFDNKTLYGYSCTSELRGTTGSTLAGIGTFSHEFGHVLGLPDYYDTDYTGSGGYSVGLYNVSIMCSGSYNSNGYVPPAYGAIERVELGWHDAVNLEMLEDGEYSIRPCTDVTNTDDIYYIPSDEDGEMFLLESRGTSGWDAPLDGSGLVITHWDNRASTDYASRLQSNNVNADPSHMLVRYIESYGTTVSSSSTRLSQISYPGEKNRTSFEIGSYGFAGWNGSPLKTQLFDIAVDSDGITTFTKVSDSDKVIYLSNITQVSANVKFIMAGSDAWTLTYQYEGGEMGEKSGLYGSETSLSKLTAGKTYTLTATTADGDVYTEELTTLSLTDTTPAIQNVSGSYTVGDTYSPALTNITEDYVGMNWVIAGENITTSDTYTFTTSGSYNIECELVYSDGSTEVFTKEITVAD